MHCLPWTFKVFAAHPIKAAFMAIEKWASLQVKVSQVQPLRLVVCHAQWQHDGWTNWWTYPFFMVGTLVTHKYKWEECVIGGVRKSITQFWEQQWREMGLCSWEEEEGDLLALLPESLYSSQHHVVLPNKASQQCCTVEHKTNLLPRLITMQAWLTSGEDPSGIQNKTLKEPSVPEGYVAQQSTVRARDTQQGTQLGFTCTRFVGFVANSCCKQHLNCVQPL